MLRNSLKRLHCNIWLIVTLSVSVCLFLVLFQYQLTRGCWLGEWPFEAGCKADRPTGVLSAESPEVFETHLIRNPGDSLVYSWLALNRWSDANIGGAKSLDAALKMFPTNEQLLISQADVSLKKQEWHEAATSLMTLIQIGNHDAKGRYLELIAYEASRPVALGLISSKSVWLDQLIKWANPKFSINALLAVFDHGKKLGLISADTTISMIGRLQSSGQWLDAYGLWVDYHGKLKNGFFNAGFDAQISQKAFDWKWSQSKELRKTMAVRQVAAQPNLGMYLELEFFGLKAIPLPMVHQYVILHGDEYLFSGRYYADKLDFSDGLSWKFSCASGSEPWAQTEPLLNTQKQWRSFELKLNVPASCGAAILVGLETKNRGDSKGGISGLVQFDGFALSPVDKL